ncbi:hypothetical protein HK405_000918 [Cladochytrium tenue]|nr:hypothetical protein HK405_000918 [Cladochytrium tenue]
MQPQRAPLAPTAAAVLTGDIGRLMCRRLTVADLAQLSRVCHAVRRFVVCEVVRGGLAARLASVAEHSAAATARGWAAFAARLAADAFAVLGCPSASGVSDGFTNGGDRGPRIVGVVAESDPEKPWQLCIDVTEPYSAAWAIAKIHQLPGATDRSTRNVAVEALKPLATHMSPHAVVVAFDETMSVVSSYKDQLQSICTTVSELADSFRLRLSNDLPPAWDEDDDEFMESIESEFEDKLAVALTLLLPRLPRDHDTYLETAGHAAKYAREYIPPRLIRRPVDMTLEFLYHPFTLVEGTKIDPADNAVYPLISAISVLDARMLELVPEGSFSALPQGGDVCEELVQPTARGDRVCYTLARSDSVCEAVAKALAGSGLLGREPLFSRLLDGVSSYLKVGVAGHFDNIVIGTLCVLLKDLAERPPGTFYARALADLLAFVHAVPEGSILSINSRDIFGALTLDAVEWWKDIAKEEALTGGTTRSEVQAKLIEFALGRPHVGEV